MKDRKIVRTRGILPRYTITARPIRLFGVYLYHTAEVATENYKWTCWMCGEKFTNKDFTLLTDGEHSHTGCKMTFSYQEV